MHNLRMQEMLRSGEALDVRKIGVEVEPGFFKLTTFVDGKDYCDARSEQWIWSIGLLRETGEIYAATDAVLYQNPRYETLWLR